MGAENRSITGTIIVCYKICDFNPNLNVGCHYLAIHYMQKTTYLDVS